MKSDSKPPSVPLSASTGEGACTKHPTEAPTKHPKTKPATQPVAPNPDSKLLTVREAAYVLRCSKSYLDKLRCLGGGPVFMRMGPRKVLYERISLEGWARGRRFDSTSQYPQPAKRETMDKKG